MMTGKSTIPMALSYVVPSQSGTSIKWSIYNGLYYVEAVR